ncbi:MAG: UDP-N-acetylmuramoyl-tripeptide--D-alanyl-D-alanine ligase [Geminicoccaceae bacterium]
MSKPLWTAVDAASATTGRSRRYWEAERVGIDSRTVGPGDLFVALQAARDGHAFVGNALDRGATAAVVTARPDDVPEDAPLLLVEDSMRALEGLAAFARRRSAAKIIGVTGSVGKTGFKTALARICGRFAPTHASERSYNNHWGVPLSLANLPPAARYGIFEMGMNHPGEIRALTAQVRPDIAVVTAIAPAHMEFFTSLDAIAEAKAEIFYGLEPDGVAVINNDAPSSDLLLDHARAARAAIITYGGADGARVRLVDSELRADRSLVHARLDSRKIDFEVGIPGYHWVINSLGLVAVAHALELPLDGVFEQLAVLEAVAGRGLREHVQLAGGGEILLLDESYNANPVSTRAAIEVLGNQSGRKVAILGDMLELGAHSARMHAELGDALDDADVDLLLLAGPMMAHLGEAVGTKREWHHATGSRELAAGLGAWLRAGDVVLVKGSLGSGMQCVVDAIHGMGAGVVQNAHEEV